MQIHVLVFLPYLLLSYLLYFTSILLHVCVLHFVQILFRRYGWAKSSFLYPIYRYIAKHYRFEDYSSKGSSVHSVKRYHRSMDSDLAIAAAQPVPPIAGDGQ